MPGVTAVTRRTVLGGIAAGAAAAAAAAHAVAGPQPLTVRQLSERGWFVGDGGYNNLVLVGDHGLVLCDAPPSYGTRLTAALRQISDLPVTHLLYSHEHVDHIAGAGAITPRPEIIASEATAVQLRRRADPARPVPTRTVRNHEVVTLQGMPVEIVTGPPAHCIDTTYIRVPGEGLLMAVDLIYPGWMPYKNLGDSIDLPGVVEAHETMLAMDWRTLVAGHVDRTGTREDVEVSLELYRDLAESAQRQYAALSFPQYLAATPSPLTSWERHELYETELVKRMVADVRPRWINRLKGVDTYLADNCWAMLETLVVQGAPKFGARR